MTNQKSKLSKANKYSIYPIEDTYIWSLYKKSVAVFWTPEELDLTKDKKYFMQMTNDEKHFIKMILCFFSSADALVNCNLVQRFMIEIDNPEIQSFYTFQAFMETIHQETYSLLIDTLIDAKEKNICFNAIENIKTVAQKAAWCIKYTKSNESLSKRLIAFALVEGVFFSGAFCAIYWLKTHHQAKLQGLCKSNEFIARDEGLHTEFAVYLYNKLDERLSENEIHQMFIDAVNIEKDFICDALPCRLVGMNSDLMITYIEFVADRLLIQLGYKKLYNSSNPFTFMELISIEGKTNFFEQRVSEYSRSDAFGTNEDAFLLDSNF